MKEETSVLDIFQDPLFTLIALILLGTLWIITPIGRMESGPDVSQIQKEIDKLKEEIKALDRKIAEFGRELNRLIDEIHAIEEVKKRSEEDERQELNRLTQEIERIKAIIQDKKEELKRLEEELKGAKKRAEESKLAIELDQKIKKLKEEIADKEAVLKKLEKEAEEARDKARRTAEEQRKSLDELRLLVAAESEEVRKIEEEKRNLEGFVKGRSGIGIYSTDLVKDKEQIAFECINNRLVLINEDNYDIEVFLNIYDSRIVKCAKLTKKSSVEGESIDAIGKPNSKFQKELGKDPQKYYMFFGVRKGSFEVFLRARQIAWQRGFVVGWRPWEEGPIFASPSGGEVEGRK